MKTNFVKKIISCLLVFLICICTFTGGNIAASEEATIRGIAFPREGDDAFDGEWGHDELFYMGGWHTNENRMVS